VNAYSWEELRLGLKAYFSVTVTDAMMQSFRGCTGDLNPLHVDVDTARREGFEAPVVYGLLTASFYSTLAGMHLPGRACLLHGVNVSFHRPVYVGDRLTVSGEVSYRNEALRQAELHCLIANQRGERVSSARLKVGVREQQS
jgi:3-hydroxybutyryl-CoA dehydratase